MLFFNPYEIRRNIMREAEEDPPNDYTVEGNDDDNNNAGGGNNAAPAAQDANANNPATAPDPAANPAPDPNAGNQNNNPAPDANPSPDPAANPDSNPQDAPEDYTIPDAGGDNPDPAAGGDPNAGGGDNPDAAAGGEGDPNAGAGGDAGGGDAPADTGSTDVDTDTGGGDEASEKIKKLNDEIFASFSPEQIAIKDTELKQRYMNMYDDIKDLIERMNEIPKTDESIHTLYFVSNKLDEMSQMVTEYITSTYATLTYIENEINFNKFMGTLNGINDVLDELGSKLAIAYKKEKQRIGEEP